MKISILFILIVNFTSILVGQEYEAGVSLGGTNFIGDIGKTNYINPNKVGAGIIFKYNWNPRIALRARYNYLQIGADNSNIARDLPLFDGSNISNLNFSNTVHELGAGMEFNFYEYDIASEDKSWTPYLIIELAAFNYKIVQSVVDISTREYNYKNKTAFTAPFGVGFKSRLTGNIGFSIETTFRYTFQDDLDFATDKIPSLDYGGTGNDWYVFTGVSLIYTFGRPACYTEGL